ncbi:DNA repair protein RecN [Thiobacter aerophilum]|uniref:DNA repair protein RecN n=1 Tax=Thiobacter aerophilum TaxID=3121275 RepID=A0ABV0EGY9_9BURK
MLVHLSVRDFVIVDRVELDFEPGFTVLTGETGAGKSILIDALALVLGDRADAAVVREGCARAEIAAQFDIGRAPEIGQWLAAQDLTGDEGVCLLRRVVDASGRSRAFINGHAATLQQLREVGERLVDIHGQHAHQSLLKPATQRALLDGYAALDVLAGLVSDLYHDWQAIRRQRELAEHDAAQLAREREELEWQVQALEALDFSEEEWAALQAEHSRLAHAASLIEGAREAVEQLSESDLSLLSQLAGVIDRLRQLREYDPALVDVLEILEPAEIQLREAAYALNHYRQRLELDPERLAECEARLEAIHRAARRFRVTPERLPALLQSARTRLAELSEAGDVAALVQREATLKARWRAEAEKLSVERAKAAAELSRKVTDTLQTLAMAGARFEVALIPVPEGGSFGLENAEFRVASHAGAALRPLAKVASGGELSRISLAIQVAALDVTPVPTLIFDEVDVGIGGGVAEIVGALLKRLAQSRQVLCITHLPQVAAQGEHHLRVWKEIRDGATVSRIAPLKRDQRVEEIARMLGGMDITDTTRAHAAEMLSR